MSKVLVLLSGGMDSMVCLYIAKKENEEVEAVTFDYGQKHSKELYSARAIAKEANVPLKAIYVDFRQVGGSALTDENLKLPLDNTYEEIIKGSQPVSYVPNRNMILIAIAAAEAETQDIHKIYYGANAIDYSGYWDCRLEFIQQINELFKTNPFGITVRTPLINMTKKEIINKGFGLGTPFELSWSCYSGKDKPCGVCDSCVLRAHGFREAKKIDPLIGEVI